MTYKITLAYNNAKVAKEIVVFESKEEKDNYVNAEYYYCLNEYNKRIVSKKEERVENDKHLSSKRKAFASHMGYHPSKQNPYIWRKMTIDNDIA